MGTRRILAFSLLAAVALPLGAAHADGCTISVDTASTTAPHLTDPANDWEGVVFGNGQATVPGGDVYREGTDITAAWISRAGASLSGTIQVASLGPAQPNSIFYLLWDYAGSGDPVKTRRFVSAALKANGQTYSYGYYNPTGGVSGGGLYFTEGFTTGSVDVASSTISMNIPSGGLTEGGESNNDWGAPTSTLTTLEAQSAFLAGSPETLPKNPSGFRRGFVEKADFTDLGSGCDAGV